MMKIGRSMTLRLLALSLLFVTACSPVGGGIGPVRLVVNGPTGVADQPSARAFTCIRDNLSATLYFSDGSVGDFTSRVVWSSSNPAVARVSNGDEPAPAPNTGFFNFGTVTPVTTGTTTITASYLGLTDSIQISVGTPTNITVHLVDPQRGTPVDPPGNAFRIAAGTAQDLTVTALLDNVLSSIDGSAVWSFDAPTNDTIATINPSSGLVTGIATGGPFVARATFPACGQSATTTVSVAPIATTAGITIQPEFGTANLILGNSERYSVFADFGSGPEQDISSFAVLTSSNTTAAAFSLGAGVSNLLQSLAVGGPFNVGATFTQGTTTFTAAPVSATVVAGTLQGISITPATASVVAGSNTVVQYNVIGNYGSGVTQDVTRRTTWATSDATIGQIVATAQIAGQAVSTGTTPGTATFTGTVTDANVARTATATFTSTAPPTTTP